MKSYFLAPISPWETAVTTLTALLEHQGEAWLLKSEKGDAIAYFYLVKSDDVTGLPTIGVDISGRHHNEDEAVLSILRKIQKEVGGEIEYAP